MRGTLSRSFLRLLRRCRAEARPAWLRRRTCAASGEMTGLASPASGIHAAPRRGLRRRIVEELVAFAAIGGLKLVLHLPEKPLWRLADLAGGIAYRVSTVRRDRARRNLRRIVEWMAANGQGAESYRRAASDPRALEEIVRSAFRNHARYYVEMARAPRCNTRWVSAVSYTHLRAHETRHD